MDDLVQFSSRNYPFFLGLLMLSRGLDFLSTWVATPRLVLEANPLARRLGWRGGLAVNILFCLAIAGWGLPSIIVATTSILVAARNLQSAWLMRTLGEESYRRWIREQLSLANPLLYWSCLLGQSLLWAGLGIGLVVFSSLNPVPLAVGMGMIAYALAVLFYTALSVRKIRRDGN